jgi:anti-sigma B factor antagonist
MGVYQSERPVPQATDGWTVDSRSVVELAVAGVVDFATVAGFKDAIFGVLDQSGVDRVVVDLGELRFMDSCGVGVLLDASHEAERRNVDLRIANAHGAARLAMEALNVYDSLTFGSGSRSQSVAPARVGPGSDVHKRVSTTGSPAARYQIPATPPA